MIPRVSLFTILLLVGQANVCFGQAKPIRLFNGKDLAGWHVWTTAHMHENPGIFRVEEGLLKIVGGKDDEAFYGGLITNADYSDYHLTVEYKWDGPTWGKRKDAARDSGILLHAIGPYGPGPWMTSIECQIIEGGTGDFIFIGGLDNEGNPFEHGAAVTAEKRGEQLYFDPKANPLTVAKGRINWFGRDPEWKDVRDFRGKNDVESPFGEWTRVECLCEGDAVTNLVNGIRVNRITKSAAQRGKIMIQTEGADLSIRRIDLVPLGSGKAAR